MTSVLTGRKLTRFAKMAACITPSTRPQWNGKITLRGLSERAYHVTNYVDGKDLGTVRGPVATFDVKFEKHLLLEAKPE